MTDQKDGKYLEEIRKTQALIKKYYKRKEVIALNALLPEKYRVNLEELNNA